MENIHEIIDLLQIPSDIVFSDHEYIAEGTHSVIYRVQVAGNTFDGHTHCLKVFRKDWMTPYNLETTAYAYLVDAGVKQCIPKVYGWGVRTMSGWGLEHFSGDDTARYCAILIEWIDGAQHLSEENVTIDNAVSFVNGLAQIHNAGVLHYDTFPRNMLVVPGTTRGVWVDFSCSHIGQEEHHDSEMYSGGGIAIRYVSALLDSTLTL
jgi:hypothetical protein